MRAGGSVAGCEGLRGGGPGGGCWPPFLCGPLSRWFWSFCERAELFCSRGRFDCHTGVLLAPSRERPGLLPSLPHPPTASQPDSLHAEGPARASGSLSVPQQERPLGAVPRGCLSHSLAEQRAALCGAGRGGERAATRSCWLCPQKLPLVQPRAGAGASQRALCCARLCPRGGGRRAPHAPVLPFLSPLVTFLSSASTALSMHNNSVFGDLKSDEAELLYSAYGDETGVQCALRWAAHAHAGGGAWDAHAHGVGGPGWASGARRGGPRMRTRAAVPGRAFEACLWMSRGGGQGQRVGQRVQTVGQRPALL